MASPLTAQEPASPDAAPAPGAGGRRRAARGRAVQRALRSGRLASAVSLAGVLLAWQLAAMWVDDPLFLPRVDVVARHALDMYSSGSLMPHVWVSLQRALIGFTIAAVAGALLGLALGSIRVVDRFVSPLISLSYPIPKIGLVPLFILWLGIGEASKLAVIVAAAIYPVVINVYAGVRGIDGRLIWRARTLGVGRVAVFWRVVVPATLPSLFVGLRLAMGLSWILLFAAEMVAAQQGLGHLIIRAQQLFQTSTVFVSLGAIAILGFIFDRIVDWLSRTLCGWHYASAGRTT